MERDLQTLETIELTADKPWSPDMFPPPTFWAHAKLQRGANADIEDLPSVLGPRLGTTNNEIVKKTLKATTWMGKLDPR